MRRSAPVAAAVAALIILLAPAAYAQATLVKAAEGLRRDPVYVDPAAERARDVNADTLRSRIRGGQAAVFVAVLPASAADDVGGDANQLPPTLGQDVGLRGTYAVLAGNSFRAASNSLARGRAGTLATASFQAASSRGPEAVLETFIDRLNDEVAGTAAGGSSGSGGSRRSGGAGFDAGTGILLAGAAGGGGFLLWRRAKRRRQEQAVVARQRAGDRQMVRAELSVLADDVMALEPQVALHPEAREDYDAGVARYKAAEAALEYADDQVDLVRVARVVDEGRYAMSRARARIEGRQPPPPPESLTRPGRRDEPALDLDERGQPTYVGHGSPFYGGGWFGGGGGILTGLLLGSLLEGGTGGGGWGGGWGGGGWVDTGDGDGPGWGDAGGGDFGAGDVGGGDFGGGGDVGGGDF